MTILFVLRPNIQMRFVLKKEKYLFENDSLFLKLDSFSKKETILIPYIALKRLKKSYCQNQ